MVRGYGPNLTIERVEAHLRTYLGIAPGVGKTYAMLNEGRQAAREGRDVVAGWLEHMALCRCGHSKNKPFCDGTHVAIGFDGTLKH